MNSVIGSFSNAELIQEFLKRDLFSGDLMDYFYTFDSPEFEAKYAVLDAEINSTAPAGLSLKDKKSWVSNRGRRVGKAFEELCGSLLKMTTILNYHSDVSTEISEIDFLIEKSSPAANSFDVFKISNGFILGEAKCYAGNKFDGDWLIKVRGRMDQHNINLALLFVSCQKDKFQGAPYKNFMVNSAQQKYIIPIGKNCLERLRNGENFIRLLSRQFDSLKSYSAIAA